MMIRLIRDTSGGTAIEYALIVAIISVGLITALGVLQGDIWAIYTNTIGGFLADASQK
jgi:Flp pilus assembly pilin Flp